MAVFNSTRCSNLKGLPKYRTPPKWLYQSWARRSSYLLCHAASYHLTCPHNPIFDTERRKSCCQSCEIEVENRRLSGCEGAISPTPRLLLYAFAGCTFMKVIFLLLVAESRCLWVGDILLSFFATDNSLYFRIAPQESTPETMQAELRILQYPIVYRKTPMTEPIPSQIPPTTPFQAASSHQYILRTWNPTPSRS